MFPYALYISVYNDGLESLFMSKNRTYKVNWVMGGLLLTATIFSTHYTQAFAEDTANPFELGTVTVTAPRSQVGEVGEGLVGSLVSDEDMRKFNRKNVGDAVNLLSGVTVSNNSRNEKMVYVRGFDPRQVPLFIDGVPVYVPYDGYVDFNRFTTADIADVQVAKGFSSVVYGANTLGGAINLVSRKPTKELEGDVTVGYAGGNERHVSANAGTNRKSWYLQAGADYLDSDYFPLSSDFTATATENGGHRNNSYRKDGKASIKVGVTPNTTDEYALSYIRQDGEKGQPPSTDPTAARYWKWPYWNKESVYFISKTALGDSETLRLRLYHDQFDNEVDSYTDGSYGTLKTSGSGSVSTGKSIYNDNAPGGSVELETKRIKNNTIKLITHYRQDNHEETDANGQINADFQDTLRSYSAEDNINLTDRLMLSAGFARHEISPDSVFSRGNAYSLPSKQAANNGQAGLFFDYTDQTRFYVTIAQKTRLPTLKDRYSQRLGSYIENPGLKPEEAVNYEVGYQGQLWGKAKAEAALFYSDINDKIQSAFVSTVGSSCTSGNKCQMQNVGEVHIPGFELGINSPINTWLEAGANYTYLTPKVTSDPSVKLTDIPSHKFTTHVTVRPVAKVEVIGFVEADSWRWASNTVKLNGFMTADVKAVYHPADNLSMEAGINNLADKNYSLANGFPNPGRTFFANAIYRF